MNMFAAGQLLAALLLLNSCVTFQGAYKDHNKASRFGPITQKISVNFKNTSIILDEKGRSRPGVENPIVQGHILMNSGFFLTTQSINGEEDLHFRFQTINYDDEYGFFNNFFNGLYLGASFLTLTAIPFYFKDYRRLKVDVVQRGNVLKSYFYKSYNVLFSWLLAAPFWRPSDFGDYWYKHTEYTKVLDAYLINEFLKEFYRDFMPKPAARKKS